MVAVIFITSVALFILSFFYLDKEKHRIYYYVINLDGHDIGAVKIDKYETEDKLLYKSISDIPFAETFTKAGWRIVLDRKHNLESCLKKIYNKDAEETIYAENGNDSVSFVSVFGPRFAYLDNMQVRKGAFIFENDSPITYLPLIENYDFKRGRSQGLNALTFLSPSLPPMKRFVTFTSIKDEYLDIDSRRIKTENLILKIRNYPQGKVWVAKSDRSLVKIEIPQKGLVISRTWSLVTPEAKEYSLTGNGYSSKDITFKNKSLELSGTLTIPNGEGKFPGILLVWGEGPCDRQYKGLFTSMADYLSKNGFCVLRFDKRGIGSSGGDASSYTDDDLAEDVVAAIDCLASQKEVDADKIAVLGHSEALMYALYAYSQRESVKAAVFMAPSLYFQTDEAQRAEALNKMASKYKWSDEYLKLATKAVQDVDNKVKGSTRNWAYILRRKCFLKNIRNALSENLDEAVKRIKIPLLILRGGEDEEMYIDYAGIVDGMLEKYGNPNHSLTYYGYLGRFFGKRVIDGIHKIHYEADKEALEGIKNWLDKNLKAPAAQNNDTITKK